MCVIMVRYENTKKRPLYGHFGPLRAMCVIRVLICVVLYAPSDQMIREVVKGGTDAGIPGVAAGALDFEHKNPAGLPGFRALRGFYFIPRDFR